MKGDFTRNTFDPTRHFSRVLMQQGRVQLDADWNEQAAIFTHYFRTLMKDLVGPAAGPTADWGFEIQPNNADDFTIGSGHYYVDGLLCENEPVLNSDGTLVLPLYSEQPGFPFPDSPTLDQLDQNVPYLFYLDVWERHITFLENDEIREVALGGPDTATRAQVIWQVKMIPFKGAVENADPAAWLWDQLGVAHRPLLRARTQAVPGSTDPCTAAPDARYRGLENQLYRVEIHQPGTAVRAGGGAPAAPGGVATFKWSRDNGTAVAAWTGKDGNDLIVAGVHDRQRGFSSGQWVELSDDDTDLRGEPGTLVRLVKVEGDALTIDPASATGPTDWSETLKNPKVRRWDQVETVSTRKLQDGAITVLEDRPFELEDGLVVEFPSAGGIYHTGDYWLIPARVATGEIDWPGTPGARPALPPFGISHHYAPLATLTLGGTPADLRKKFDRILTP